MKKVVFFLLVFWVHFGLRAQDLCFEAYDVQTKQKITTICAGRQVKFVDCTGTPPDNDKEYFTIDQNAIKNNLQPPQEDTVNIKTFSQPGTFDVRQIRSILNGKTTLIQKFTVVATPPPTFTPTLCGLNQVKITITDTNYDIFEVDFGQGVNRTLNRGGSYVHQYSSAGSYSINVTGRFNQGVCFAVQSYNFTTLPAATPPVLENIKLEAGGTSGTLALRNLQPDYLYVIERQEGNTFVPVQTLNNPAASSQTVTLTGLNTQTASCFRVRVTDNCNSNLATSNLICSLPLTSSAGNKAINLTWPAYPDPGNLVRYEIYKNGNLYRNEQAATYTDTDINCGKKYCYQVIAVLRNPANTGSFSNQSCQTGSSTQPPKPGTITSTFTPTNQVSVVFMAPADETVQAITLQRSTDNGTFTAVTSAKESPLTDNLGISNLTKLCYNVTYQDSCGNTSPVSNTTCPALLKAELATNKAELSWTEFTGFTAGIQQYVVEQLDETGAITRAQPATSNRFTDILSNQAQRLIYRIKVVGSQAGEISYSNTVVLNQESTLVIPTAFTPNGDNLNDRFEVKSRFLNTYRLRILNRWGQVIFESDNLQQGWDGQVNGKPAPIGAYPYQITAQDINGKYITKSGTVTLLR